MHYNKAILTATVGTGLLFLGIYGFLNYHENTIIEEAPEVTQTSSVVEEPLGEITFEEKEVPEEKEEKNSNVQTLEEILNLSEKNEETDSETKLVDTTKLSKEEYALIAAKYSQNYSKEAQKNADYTIRPDGIIPAYNEPINDNEIYFPAFTGYRSDEYRVVFYPMYEYELDTIVSQIENAVGYKILNYEPTEIKKQDTIKLSSMYITMDIPKITTAKEVEHVKTEIRSFDFVNYVNPTSVILPEYDNEKYEEVRTESDLLGE